MENWKELKVIFRLLELNENDYYIHKLLMKEGINEQDAFEEVVEELYKEDVSPKKRCRTKK